MKIRKAHKIPIAQSNNKVRNRIPINNFNLRTLDTSTQISSQNQLSLHAFIRNRKMLPIHNHY